MANVIPSKRRKGMRGQAFSHAIKAINGEVLRKLKIYRKKGRRYFSKDDLRYAYDRFKGSCAKCGMQLAAAGGHQGSADFTLRVSLDAGGAITRNNLLPVCKTCKKEKRPKRIAYPTDRVFDFNTIGDVIAHLTSAVIDKDEERITYFKRQVNETVNEFVQTLYYKPVAGKCEPVERYEGENTMADQIADLAREINLTKEYTILRRPK